MMKAIVLGENHMSKADRQKLLRILSKDIDALFQEGREDKVTPENWSVRYLAFVSGVLTWICGQSIFRRLRGFPKIEFTPIHDDIDLTYPEMLSRIQEETSGWLFGLVYFLSGGILLSGIFVPVAPAPIFDIWSFPAWFMALLKPIMVLCSPFIFGGLIIGIDKIFLENRDDEMVNNIIEIAAREDYEMIVVACGHNHVEPICSQLEDFGWDVRPNPNISKVR